MLYSDVFEDEAMEMIEYHSKSNPGLWKPLFRIYSDAAEKIFGEYKNGKDAIYKYQMLHCELIRLSMELYRRRKGYSWGLVYWMLNDCWPAAAGWSLIDYYACPKPAYYAFKRSAKPVIASVFDDDGRLSLYVCNDSLRRVEGSARLYVHDFKANSDLYSVDIPVLIEENRTEKVFECDFATVDAILSDSTVILCDLTTNICDDRALFVKERFSDLDICYAEPIILSDTDSEITVTTDQFNPCVILDLPCLLSDNCFALKANEVRVIQKIRLGDSKN